VVHHVASVFPIEIQLAQQLAKGQAIAGVSWDDVHAMNAKHAQELRDALQEITRAARSLRVLADYLERQPSSLIWGKTQEKP